MNDNDNKETSHKNETPATERREADTPGLSKRAVSNPPARPLEIPPPSSAPREFLKAQSCPVFHQVAQQPAPAPVTPPPTSAPTEFLAVQQWKKPSEKGPAGLMDDFLESAGTGPPPEFDSGIWRLQDQGVEAEADKTNSAAADAGQPMRIRGIPLARDEEITRILLSNEGLSDTLPPSGQALILTNRRLIAFRGAEGFRDTHMAKTSDIKQFSIRTGQRNWNAILQGVLMMAGGGLLYLVVSYWLAGQIRGPNIPALNIDVAPLITLLIILAGLLVLLQNYFTRPAGAIVFRGAGLELGFPFHSALDIEQIYEFVDLAQITTQRNGGAADAETLEEG